MTRKNATAAPKKKAEKKTGKRAILIFQDIRRNLGKNPAKKGASPDKPSIELIRIEDFQIDSLYQRSMKNAKIRKIATEFNPRKFGIPVVAYRGSKPYLIDGQQRTCALMLINSACPGFRTSVWCEVVPDVNGRAEEAEIFDGRNDNKPILPIENFKAEWASKDASAVSIVRALHANGITVKGIPCSGALPIICIAAVKYSHKMGVLNETIDAIRATWGLVDEAFKVTCFHPIAAVLHKNRGAVDNAQLVKTLKKFTPAGFKAMADSNGHNRTVSIANRIVDAYNKGLKKADQIQEVKSTDVNLEK